MSYSRLHHGSKSRRSNSISSRESLPGHIDKHNHRHTDVSPEDLSGSEDYELEVLHGHDEDAAVDITSHGGWRGTSGYDGEVNGHVGRSSSFSTTESFTLYTPDEERRVIRKFDRRLVLFVAFLYMLSFLDRSSMLPRRSFQGLSLDLLTSSLQDIGNAKVAGLSKDLGLSSSQFEWLLRAFYITYISFEWMTLLWKVFPPHIYRTSRPPIAART